MTSFDDGSEGWEGDVQDGGITWSPGDGNPGGYMRYSDTGKGSTSWIVAPPSFHGNWSSFDEIALLQFDQRIIDYSSGCALGQYRVRIADTAGNSAQWAGAEADGSMQWNTVCAPLWESEWAVTGSWSKLLADVALVEIRVELVNNSGPCGNVEITGIDNIVVRTDDCPADVVCNGTVDFQDILAVFAAWSAAGGRADIDRDGIVSFGDLLEVLTNWGPC